MRTVSSLPVKAILAVLLSAIIWGIWLPVTRLGVTTHLEPLDISILRFMTAGVVMLPVLWFKRALIPWRKWRLLLVIAMSAGTPYLTLFGYGMRMTTTGQGAVLGPGVTGTISLLLGAYFLHETLQKRQWLGATLTLLGVGVIVAHEASQSGVHLLGFLLVLLASLSWSTFTVASRIAGIDALLGAAIIGATNTVLLIPLGLMTGRFEVLMALPAPVLWFQAGYQGLLTGVVALITYVYAINKLGAGRAASFTPLAPVLSTLFGIYWLDDPVDLSVLMGLALVAAGVIIANASMTRIHPKADST